MQELRSTQTGVQVLTGFLLAVPFTTQFDHLDHVELTAYLVVLTTAVGASMAVLAPIAYHRILFRRGRRPWLVETANQIARVGLVLAGASRPAAWCSSPSTWRSGGSPGPWLPASPSRRTSCSG